MKTKKRPVFVREFLEVFPEEFAPAEPSPETQRYLPNLDGEPTCVAEGPGGAYVGTAEHGIGHRFGKRNEWHTLQAGTCPLPSNRINALQYDACGMLWIATDKGVCIYNGKDVWMTPAEMDTLPQEEVFSLCITEEGLCCFGVQDALILLRGGQLHRLGAKRWLPGGKVTRIAAQGNTIYAQCEEGAAKIEIRQMTLGEKAEIYQKTMQEYHLKDGFVLQRHLTEYGSMESGVYKQTDNDGLWTGVYVAAQALRYAATKDKDALAQARYCMQGMLALTEVTGIPGFTARAIRRPGAVNYGNGHPEWVKFSDAQGAGEWKRETSSDEMVGHFFAQSYYYDLCADKAEKERIRAALCGIVDHILAHDYRLHDVDGLPTTWANWNPEDLNRDSKWFWERGVNSAEMLMMLRTAHHLSGNETYLRVYDDLALNHHYLLNAARYKIDDGHDNHIDDKLGMFTLDTLLRYEDRPAMRMWLLEGLAHHWRYERVEQLPLWSFIAGKNLGRDCDLSIALDGLAQYPLDLINYPVRNSCRSDLVWNAAHTQLLRPLPFDEAPIDHFGHNRFEADGGTGMESIFGAIYLLPYWYGRYWGLIQATE